MELKKLLNEIEKLKAELDSYRPFDRETWQKLEQKVRLWWNYHSNAIEGNRLSQGETNALILHGLTAKGKPLKDHLDIEGHDDAVKYLEEVVQEDHPITEKFIKDLQEIILKEPYEVDAKTPEGQPTKKKVAVGEYKSLDNSVKTQTGEIKHYVSPEKTPARMTDLVEWYRKQEEKGKLHPVLLAANFHYEFVAIHPFDDGNGRLARLLMNLILMKHGYPPAILRIEERQDQYLSALEEADSGELEKFNAYIAEKVKDSLAVYLKAGRGESIEEEEDIDKRIAVLHQKVNKEEVQVPFSQEVVENLISGVYEKFLRLLYQDLQKFELLFSRLTTCYFQEPKPPKNKIPMMPEDINFEKLLDYFKEVAEKKGSSFHRFKAVFQLENFKQKEGSFSVEVSTKIQFNEFDFQIAYFVGNPMAGGAIAKGFSQLIDQMNEQLETEPEKENPLAGEEFELPRIPYSQKLKEGDLKNWSNQIQNQLLEWIERKYEEMD